MMVFACYERPPSPHSLCTGNESPGNVYVLNSVTLFSTLTAHGHIIIVIMERDLKSQIYNSILFCILENLYFHYDSEKKQPKGPVSKGL